ncbi:hypothetical protein B296_00020551 [Ensete ventricosum]|uniref:Uncharacterized protein n=1 Tax=Ensete ventricosum TaxID=4639 RepID=A0A426YWK4_ENSVE|nr:hypothetical protein B296_00020551 [Ensete ventricosum]
MAGASSTLMRSRPFDVSPSDGRIRAPETPKASYDIIGSFSFPALSQRIGERTRSKSLLPSSFFLPPPSISSLWVGEGKDDAGAGDQLSSFEQREVLEFCPPDGSQRRQVHSFARHFPVGRLVILAGSDSGMESDEEIRRVPEFGFEQAGPSTSGQEAGSATGADRAQSTAQAGQRRRGRSPADKEHKRLKRFGGCSVHFCPFSGCCENDLLV